MINLNFNLNVSNSEKGQTDGPKDPVTPWKDLKSDVHKNIKQFNLEKVKMQAIFLNE
jgi:hypothetical protein